MLYVSQGTLGGNFDIFAASGESTAWVLLWKTPLTSNWREGLSCSPIQFFGAVFDLRLWTMVVFWKDDSGRQPKLNTPENERGDETNYPSLPNFNFFDDPDTPLGPCGPPQPPGPPGSPGLSPGWPPAPSPAGDRERVRNGIASREQLHPRSRQPGSQLIPIPMSDDDDQLPQDERQRQRSRSRDRVYPHAQVPQEPQIHHMVTSEPDDVSDEDCAVVIPSLPSAGPLPSAEQRGRSRRDERS